MTCFGQKGETGVYPNDLFRGKNGRRRGERGAKGHKERAKKGRRNEFFCKKLSNLDFWKNIVLEL